MGGTHGAFARPGGGSKFRRVNRGAWFAANHNDASELLFEHSELVFEIGRLAQLRWCQTVNVHDGLYVFQWFVCLFIFLFIRGEFRALPDGCCAPLAPVKPVLSSGLGAARGLPPIHDLRARP